MHRMLTWFLASMLASLLLIGTASAGVTTEWTVGTTTTLLSTELNSLSSNGYSVASATYDNRIGQTGLGYTMCAVEGFVTYAATPTSTGAIIGWFLRTVDGGANFETTPTGSVQLGRPPDFVLPVTGQTATRVMVDVRCPPDRFKVSVQNNGSGQALAASGNTLKVMPYTTQGN